MIPRASVSVRVCGCVRVSLSARACQGRRKESARECGRVAELGRPGAAGGLLAGSEKDRGTSAEREGKRLGESSGTLRGVCAHGSLTMECSGTRSGTKRRR